MGQRGKRTIALMMGIVLVVCILKATISDSAYSVTAEALIPTLTSIPGPPQLIQPQDDDLLPLTDTEVVVLQQAAEAIGCPPEIAIEGSTYSFFCMVTPGHFIDAHVQRFVSALEAQAAFEAARGTHLLESFHCCPAYSWLYEQEPMPARQQGHSWVAERWLVTTHNLDDTGMPIAPSPVTASEAIYRAAIMNHLFQACDVIYLPFVSKNQ